MSEPTERTAPPLEGATDPHAEPGQTVRGSHLGFVAHEIRNPLSTALWTAELLVKMKAADRAGARGDKLTALCLRSVSRIRLLVEDFLLSERLDAGGYPVRPEAVPLAEAVEAAAARALADRSGLALDLAPGLAVRADRLLLERALEGLLGVAAHEGAAVRVEARLRGGAVEVRLSGAPPVTLEDLHKGAPTDQSGRTLAPAMARRVAAALGGSLALEAESYLLSIPSA